MTSVEQQKQTFKFQIWERLRLVTGEEGREGTYICRISDIKKDRLVISRPVFERGSSLLADNRAVKVFCARSDAVYICRARIKETDPKSRDEMYLLDLSSVQRTQRRRFVRIDEIVKLRYSVLEKPLRSPVEPEKLEWTLTTSGNISAGGMLINCPREIAEEELLLLNIELSDLKNLPRYLLAVCRHAEKDLDNLITAGVEFILHEDIHHYLDSGEMNFVPPQAMEFNDTMQNKLVSELFAEQLLMRKKGIL